MSSAPAFAPEREGGPSALAGSRPRIVGDASLRRAGRAKDQPVVGLDDVDDSVEPGLDVEREPLMLDDAVGGLGLIRDREIDAACGARESQLRIGIESSRGLSRARQDANRPIGELDHSWMVPTGATQLAHRDSPAHRRATARTPAQGEGRIGSGLGFRALPRRWRLPSRVLLTSSATRSRRVLAASSPIKSEKCIPIRIASLARPALETVASCS